MRFLRRGADVDGASPSPSAHFGRERRERLVEYDGVFAAAVLGARDSEQKVRDKD